MDYAQATDFAREAVVLVLILASPILLTGMLTGLIVSILQALTQVQEMTLSFVPKILAMLISVVLTGPWIMERLVDFSQRMFSP